MNAPKQHYPDRPPLSRGRYAKWKLAVIRCVSANLVLGVLFATYALMPNVVTAQLACPCAADTYWELSSRHLSECCTANEFQRMAVRRLTDGQWGDASLADVKSQLERPSVDELDLAVAEVHTIIYVHGNWTTAAQARSRGQAIYRALRNRCDSPINFIIYSWPSERDHGFARDVIDKKSRIDADSYFLANLLQCLPADQPSGFIGFSFGAAIVSGALHMDAGGSLAGRECAATDETKRPVRVSMLAPAFDRNFLCSTGQYGRALERIDQLVNLFNSSDPVLKRFRFFDRSTSPSAAGFAGLVMTAPRRELNGFNSRPGQPLHADPKIIQYDCCKSIGRTHSEVDYFQKCGAIGRALDNVLGF